MSRGFGDASVIFRFSHEVRAKRPHHEPDRCIDVSAAAVELMIEDRRCGLWSYEVNDELALLSKGLEGACDDVKLVGSLVRETCSMRGKRGAKVMVGTAAREAMGSGAVRRVDSSVSPSSDPVASLIGLSGKGSWYE